MTINAPVLLAIGANLSSSIGPPEETISESLADFAPAGVEVTAVSPLYRTPAFPPDSGPEFVNGAVLCKSALPADEILGAMKKIEEKFGRGPSGRWAARVLDIDLLGVGDLVLPDLATFNRWYRLSPERQQEHTPSQLVLPHPRMHQRAFVLIPLADIAPGWKHPVLAKTVKEMLADLPKSELAGISVL